MIRLLNVKKYYGTWTHVICAVDGVSLTITKGEFAIITGRSGSGKSTLLNLMCGMTRPDEGAIRITGIDILAIPDHELSKFRAHHIGLVFQFQSMLSMYNALENVCLPGIFRGDSRDAKSRERAEDLLESVGLKSRADAYVHELSAGQQRRVGIARALFNSPCLLLCDEPTGDLDRETEKIIMVILSEANKKGTTVVMTTHNLDLRAYASKTFSMENGFITED